VIAVENLEQFDCPLGRLPCSVRSFYEVVNQSSSEYPVDTDEATITPVMRDSTSPTTEFVCRSNLKQVTMVSCYP
jgi:hypothetical protein